MHSRGWKQLEETKKPPEKSREAAVYWEKFTVSSFCAEIRPTACGLLNMGEAKRTYEGQAKLEINEN